MSQGKVTVTETGGGPEPAAASLLLSVCYLCTTSFCELV